MTFAIPEFWCGVISMGIVVVIGTVVLALVLAKKREEEDNK